MSAQFRILRAGPLCTIQDGGRAGMLMHGISASGPMDRIGYVIAGARAGASGDTGVEITRAGLDLVVEAGPLDLGWAGGVFAVAVNGVAQTWPGGASLTDGDVLSITPGPTGNYGYLRFGAELQLPSVLNSRATSTRARLGGLDGRALAAGDRLVLTGEGRPPQEVPPKSAETGPIRFIWGIHAERFSAALRARFVTEGFSITPMMDRMGVRLADGSGVFKGVSILSLVSDPILPGDIQILGDGTPIVLMRDHQPTGGYPRIGTVISADLDRFAQMRPGEPVAFEAVSVEHAQQLLRSGRV